MSVYGYLVCNRVRKYLFLGKHLGNGFWRNGLTDQALDIAILKFARDHRGHAMSTLLEHQVDSEFFDFDEVSPPESSVSTNKETLVCAGCDAETATALGRFLAEHLEHALSYNVQTDLPIDRP